MPELPKHGAARSWGYWWSGERRGIARSRSPGDSRVRIPQRLSNLSEIRAARCARKGNHVSDVFQAREIHHHALQAEAETGVRRRAEAAQIQVPPIRLFVQAAVAQSLQQHVVAFFALAAADDL